MRLERTGALASPVSAADPGIHTPQWVAVVYWAAIGACVVMLVAVGSTLMRRSLQRRRVSRTGADQQLKWRGQFIAALIERVGRDTYRSARLGWICKRLGWTKGQADLIIGYLTAKGLVEKTAWMKNEGEPFATLGAIVGRERVRLTAAGVDEAERAERGPTDHLPQITAIDSIVVTGPNARVSASVKSPDSTQTLHQEGLDPSEVMQWIGDYWEALTDAALLSAAERAKAEHLLVRIEEANQEGDRERVARLGRALRAIAEGVAGNAAYGALVAAARSLFG